MTTTATQTKPKTAREVRAMIKDLEAKRQEALQAWSPTNQSDIKYYAELDRLSALIVALRWTLGLVETLK